MKRIGDVLKMSGGGTVTGRLESATLMRANPPRVHLDIEMLVPPLKRSGLEALAARDQMARIDYSKMEARITAMYADAVQQVVAEMKEAQADRDEATCGATMAAIKYGAFGLTYHNT